MTILSFETSTAIGSVSLFHNDHLIGEKKSIEQKKHSEFIHQAISALLAEAQIQLSDIDTFAVSVGPGSFTGIRVAVNAVRTFSHLLNKPVSIFNSLEILASQTIDPVIPMINAYKNMVYLAAYEAGNCIIKPQAIPLIQFESFLSNSALKDKKFLVVGDGYNSYSNYFQKNPHLPIFRKSELSDFPLSSHLGSLAKKNINKTFDWKTIIPLYIRASEAEENLKKTES